MRELKQDWRDIFQSGRVACDPKKMLLGLVWGYLTLFVAAVGLVLLKSSAQAPLVSGFLDTVKNPLTQWDALPNGICLWLSGPVYWPKVVFGGLGMGLISLGLWTYFGGSILRLCAVQCLRDDTIAFRDATDFAWQKKRAFFGAPLVPLIIVGVTCGVLYVGGWLAGLIPWVGPLALGVFFPFALLAGLCMTLTLIGGVVGYGLMGPTIAVEGTDAFDAISRAFNYVFQRPWRFIWHNLVAAVHGSVCIAFVGAVAYLTIMFPVWICGKGMGQEFWRIQHFLDTWQSSQGPLTVRFAAVLIKAWAVFVGGVVLGYAVSYCCASQTIIYALLRRDIDGTDMNEVYLEEEEEDFAASLQAEPEDASAEADAFETGEDDAYETGEEDAFETAEGTGELEAEDGESSAAPPAKKKAKRKRKKKAKSRKRKKKSAE